MSDFKHEIQVCQVIPALSTSIYTANEVLFNTTLIPGRFYSGKIKGVTAIDKDDVGEASVLYFLKSNVNFGAANIVPAITDADGGSLIGTLTIAAGTDIGAFKVTHTAADIAFDSLDGLIYVAGITTTGLTHTVSGMVYNIAIEKMS